MSDLLLHQLQQMRAENAVRHEEVLGKIGDLSQRVSSLEDRMASVEVLIVRQQRQLYEFVDRQATQH
jgi:hypothetical protein